MKKLAAIALSLLLASSAFAEDKFGGVAIYNVTGGGNTGTVVPNPTQTGQFLGSFDTTVEWETLQGGVGNCTFSRTGAGSGTGLGIYALDCPGYVSSNSPTFTGTIRMPDFSTWSAVGVGDVSHIGIGQPVTNDLLDVTGNTNGGSLSQFINTNAGATAYVEIRLSNGTTTGSLVMGGTGYNNPGGLYTSNTLTLGSGSANGLNIGASSATPAPIRFFIGGSSASNLMAQIDANGLHIIKPLALIYGGTGAVLTPLAGQIPIVQAGATASTWTNIQGDATLSTSGALTVTTVNGVTPGQLMPLNAGVGLAIAGGALNLYTPVNVQLGGTGGIAVPSPGQLLMGQGNQTYAPVGIGGDVSLNTTGVMTVLRINGQIPGGNCPANQAVVSINGFAQPTCGPVGSGSGVPNGSPPQFIGYSAANVPENETLSGGNGACTFTRTGLSAYALNCSGFASSASPTFTGTVTMPDGARWSAAGLSGGITASFTGPVTATALNISGTATINNATISNALTANTLAISSTMTIAGHLLVSNSCAPGPTLTNCGTSQVTACSTDLSGSIGFSTNLNTCTVNFRQAYGAFANCVLTPVSPAPVYMQVVGANSFTILPAVSGNTLPSGVTYWCPGNQ